MCGIKIKSPRAFAKGWWARKDLNLRRSLIRRLLYLLSYGPAKAGTLPLRHGSTSSTLNLTDLD